MTPVGTAGGGAMTRLGDDSGVIAIIVALSISTFLLGFAALAVDLGVAYTRKAQLQSIADRLALATAAGLPAATGTNTDGSPGALPTFTTQWDHLCQPGGEGAQIWDSGVCSSTAWASDGDEKNGEIEFISDKDGGLDYDLSNPASATTTAVRVLLPPSTVQFGFGAVFGASSTQVQKSASARIGSALGMGILPFPVTDTDVSNGQFCVVDTTATPPDITPPAPLGSPLPVLSVNPSSIPLDSTAPANSTVDVTVTLRVNTALVTGLRQLSVYHSRSSTPIVVPLASLTQTPGFGYTDYSFTVKLPRLHAGSTLHVWVKGQEKVFSFFGGTKWRNFTTAFADLTFEGYPAPDIDPCTLPQAPTRGFTPVVRAAGGSALQQLQSNVRTGPQPKLYTPAAAGSLLDTLSDLCVAGTVAPASACLTQDTTTKPFSDAIRDGLLTSGGGRAGRLVGDCGNGTTSSNGYSGVDASQLMSAGSPLVDQSLGYGTGADLRLNIETGGPVKPGWVTAQALRCPRMAVVPVVSNLPLTLPAGGAAIGGRAITGFVYLWIDGITADRGLDWNGGTLRSVSGYLIDPGYLPPVVAGSGVVGPYLGDGMPKEATLICDLGDRASGRCDDAL